MTYEQGKRLEDLFPDPELRARGQERLYGGGPLLGEGSVFSEMLQALVSLAH